MCWPIHSKETPMPIKNTMKANDMFTFQSIFIWNNFIAVFRMMHIKRGYKMFFWKCQFSITSKSIKVKAPYKFFLGQTHRSLECIGLSIPRKLRCPIKNTTKAIDMFTFHSNFISNYFIAVFGIMPIERGYKMFFWKCLFGMTSKSIESECPT